MNWYQLMYQVTIVALDVTEHLCHVISGVWFIEITVIETAHAYKQVRATAIIPIYLQRESLKFSNNYLYH